ncbi:MAG: HD domain-containing protein [Gemmatimonadota bacterium]|nr:HD domain-containing protein [Gemmatimonadota bacterium]
MSPAEVYRKETFCADLEVGDRVREVFCLSRVERRRGRNGPFLKLAFADRTGEIGGVAWEDVDDLLEVLSEGAYARIEGEIREYRGERQLNVTAAEEVGARVHPADFLPRGPVPGEESMERIEALLETVEDPWLERLLGEFLDDPGFVDAFASAPAAKANHHAYVGGLAEHTLSVMELCASAAEHYGELDRDLLLVGAFFHDVGKIEELAVEPGFGYTERGSLLGHIPLGYAAVRERIGRIEGFPGERATDLGHLILSHQGELEWGSPVQPRTLEALVLHFLDNLDSKVATARTHLADVESGRTAYVRSLGRALVRRAETIEENEAPSEPPAATGGGPDAGEREADGGSPSLFDEMDDGG